MENQLIVKVFDRGMLGECVDLFMDTFSKEPWNDVYESRQQVVDFFENHMGSNYFLGYVLLLKDEIVGLCIGQKKPWIKGMEYFVDQFCVGEKYQGRGFGSEFLRRIEERMPGESINAIILMTDRGFPSEKFYLRNGFKTLEEILVLAK